MTSTKAFFLGVVLMFLYDWWAYRNIARRIDERYKKVITGYRKTISGLIKRCRAAERKSPKP